MKDKNQKHFLDDTVKRAKIENAHREAENIYNYNKWKDNHEKMVNHELKKMQHKDHKVIKAVLIGILLALIIEIVYILIINDPQTLTWIIHGVAVKVAESHIVTIF